MHGDDNIKFNFLCLITGRLSPSQSVELTLVSGNISGPSDKEMAN
jgi:hypothetical protein